MEEECENGKLLDTELWIFSSREAVFTRVVMAGVICWIMSTWQRQRHSAGEKVRAVVLGTGLVWGKELDLPHAGGMVCGKWKGVV